MNRRNNWGFNSRGRNRGGFNRGRGRGWRQNRYFGGIPDGRPQNYAAGPSNHWKKKHRREAPTKRLSEEAIGVIEYISEHEGFNGVIKSRYSDFQVSEINVNGEIAKLTDKSAPEPPKDETVDEDEDLLLTKYNVDILPIETWDKINSLATGASTEAVEIDVTDVSKEQRTKIHEAVKKAFGKGIIGSTVNVDDKKLIKFQKYKKGIRIDKRVKWIWPAEYVHFIVHKENCDTLEAAVRISERLRINLKPNMLGYSGTKDRRAKTSQWFSLRKVDPRKVVTACQDLREIHVGNFSFSKTHLKLGMLKGNVFRIALRNVTASDESVNEACDNLLKLGFINYYGLQRFGSRINKPTYDIGLKLFQGNLKEAIESVLEEREGPMEHALSAYRTGGPQAALAALPRSQAHSHAEVRLIQALAHNPNDLVAAIKQIPRNVRLLYLHSYQSLVWNKAVSERIKKFGLKPAVGDLVPVSDLNYYESEYDESDNEEDKNESETQDDGETKNKESKDGTSGQIVEKIEDGGTEQDGDTKQNGDTKEDGNTDGKTKESMDKNDESEGVKEKIPIKVLTQEDIDGGAYTIFDIVMPLPGSNIDYPPNMKYFYEDMLTKDGIRMDMKHKMKSCKSFNMSGAYRHVVVRPMFMEWRCVQYNDPFADLILSDLDEMHNRKITGIVEGGQYKALLLTMSLPSSCYATMALRELLKVDTSCDFQALQNNYHKKKTEKETKEVETNETSEGRSKENNESIEGSTEKMEEDTEVSGKKRMCEEEDQNVKKLKVDDGGE